MIDPPINTFAFCPDSCTNVFIAGGIGITPIMSMIQECERGSNPWKLYYAAKSRSDAAFASQFEDLHHVRLHFSNAQRTRLDIKEIVENAAMDAHLYCCGPTEMIESFREATFALAPSRVHYESFAPIKFDGQRRPITVKLARAGKTVQVSPEKSILEALLQVGIRVPLSCRQGTCGNCEVDVLQGIPDHQDKVLSVDERASNKTIITCCSWSKTDNLLLDL